MKHTQLTLLLVLSALSACGGRAVEEPGSGASGPDEPGTDQAAAGRGSSSSSSSLPTHDLGDCKPGFSRADYPERPCNWLTKSGVCFDKKEAACSCVCPTSGTSICFSGFDSGPGSATLVQCS